MKQNLRLALAAVLCLAVMTVAGCNFKKKNLPPGAINSFDAYAYDGLATAKGAIDGFKSKYNNLSQNDQDFVKPYLNQLIADYNAGEASWQVYHATGTGDTAALSSNLQSLVNDIAQITQAFAKKGVK